MRWEKRGCLLTVLFSASEFGYRCWFDDDWYTRL